MGGDGGVRKPKFFEISTTGGSVFRNIYLLNCAHFCVGVSATDVHIYGFTIDVVAGNLVSKKFKEYLLTKIGLTILGIPVDSVVTS